MCSQRKVNFGMVNFLVYTVFFTLLTHCYEQEKVFEHFKMVDQNNDNNIEIQEYSKLLQLQDQIEGIQQEDEYYVGMVDLLFEHYDTDRNGKINVDEWVLFATDIVDQTDPIYEEMVEAQKNSLKQRQISKSNQDKQSQHQENEQNL